MSGSPLVAAIRERASAHPDAPFIRDQTANGDFRTVSHAEFRDMVDGLRGWLSERTSPGDLVPIVAARSADCVAAIIASAAQGRVAAPINPKLRPPSILRLISGDRTGAVLTDGQVLHALTRSEAEIEILRDLPMGLLNGHRLLPFQAQAVERAFSSLPSVLDAAERGTPAEEAGPSSERLCLFTSGSTGVPKGVLIRGDDLVERARAEIDVFGLTADDVLLGLLPFSFDVGCNQLVSAVLAGCELVILDSWLGADIVAAVERFGVTGISCVPSIWRDFLNAGLRFDTGGPHARLRYVTVSGGDLSEEELFALSDALGDAGVFKTYGQTEAFRLTCLLPGELAGRPGSVGRPFATARVAAVRPDLTPAAPGEVGELILAGLGAMRGYLDGSEAEEKVIPNPLRSGPDDPETAIRTGDFGSFDEDGYLFLKGRRDSMVKISGNRVYPAEVARIVQGLPGVRNAAAVGVSRPDGEADLVVFVVVDDPAPAAEKALQRIMRQTLPPYMMPRLTLVEEAIPRTAGGKPDLRTLRERAREAVLAPGGDE